MTASVTIAVTGHRLNQLPEAERPRIAAEIARDLDSVGAAGRERLSEHTKFILASAVAEGADRYAADAALALGWTLVCPLPFEIDRYEKDFPDPASVAAFQSYLKRAKWVRSASAERVAALSAAGGAAPYAAVGEMLVEAGDVLIAVWNGQPPKGPGGTAEVGAMALEAGKPVLWIPTEEARAARLILPARLPRRGSRRRALIEGLRERFDVIPRPEGMRRAV